MYLTQKSTFLSEALHIYFDTENTPKINKAEKETHPISLITNVTNSLVFYDISCCLHRGTGVQVKIRPKTLHR